MLTKMGIRPLQAHYFVLYAAVFANITPPIAIPAIFAAQIAEGDDMKTGVQAALAGLAGFLLPFMIVFVHALTFDFSEPLSAVTSPVACVLVFIGPQPALVGYFLTELPLRGRIFAILSSAAFVVFLHNTDIIWFFVGLTILLCFVTWQVKAMKRRLLKGNGPL